MEPGLIILTTVGWLVSAILSKTVSQGWEWYTRLEQLDEKTQSLITELEKIQSLLEEAQLVQLPLNRVRLIKYLKEVKDLVYDAGDILDELDYFRLQNEVQLKNLVEHGAAMTAVPVRSTNYKFQILRHSDRPSSSASVPTSNSKSKTTSELVLDKNAMSERIESLVKKLQKRYDPLLNELNLRQLGSIAQAIHATNQTVYTNNRPQTTSYTYATNIYGRDSEINQILKLIADGRSHARKLPVIAIVGNGGVGKTTFARLVYNHSELEKQFDLKIWICASTHFDDMSITCQMLECCSAGNANYGRHLNLNNLKTILRDRLNGKKVLLVLDDIWEINDPCEWDSLLAPLNPSNTTKTECVVLVTTRYPSTAEMVKTVDPVIRLDGLDETSFWSLIKTCAFGHDEYEVPYELEHIGREIAKRLKGYPLAAKTVGAMLKGNMDARYWMEILESEKWKYKEGNEGILAALMLSYEYLPVHLKRCFSYCSLFPKDYYFTAEELVNIWMAQGFIHVNENDSRRIEDVGIEYLKCLVGRAFFQTIDTMDGTVRYVIHELLHDLARFVSKEEFLTIEYAQPLVAQPSLRHLSIINGKDQYRGNLVELKNLNTLILIQRGKYDLFSNFKLDQANKVRVLIIPCSLSHNLKNCVHLRYLSFRNDGSIISFPVEICRFYHLEVLDVMDCTIMELPREFNNLVNLRHFIASRELHCKIIGVGKLKFLQELKAFEVHKEENGFELEQLGGLKELRNSLELLRLENVKNKKEAENAKLSEKEVKSLKLSWSRKKTNVNHVSPEDILEVLQPNNKIRKLCIENYGGYKSPIWLSHHLVNFVEDINLSHCEAWEDLPDFGQLRFLTELRLSHMPQVKIFDPQFHGCSSRLGFPSLKLMEVVSMDNLETWVWSEQCEVFPSLESLTIKTCPKLKKFIFSDPISLYDEDMKLFPKLLYLSISDCPQLEQVPPIPCSHGMSVAQIKRVGSIEQIYFGDRQKLIESDFDFFDWNESNLSKFERDYLLQMNGVKITEQQGSMTLDQIFIFKNCRNIKSMFIKNCRYLITTLSWKGICLLDFLEDLWIEECPNLLLSPEEDNDDGSNFYSQKSLKYLTVQSCGITGEGLSWLLARLPAVCKLKVCHGPNITCVWVPSSLEEANTIMSPKSSLGAGDENSEPLQQCSGSLMHLEELEILDCPNMYFANKDGLSKLIALRRIQIHGCGKLLTSMCPKEELGDADWFPRNTKSLWLPSNIEYLDLDNVPDKMAWSLADLSSLHEVQIWESPNLTALDLYPFVALRDLFLGDCKRLASVKGPKSLDHHLFLVVSNCPTLVLAWSSASRELDREFLSYVAELHIDDVRIISPSAAKFLKALQSLTIAFDDKLDGWTKEQEDALLLLTNLQSLHLSELKNLSSFPAKLHRYPALKKLSIEGCPEIKSLPQKGFPKSIERLLLRWNCSMDLKSQCSELGAFEYSNPPYYEYVFVKRSSSVNGH